MLLYVSLSHTYPATHLATTTTMPVILKITWLQWPRIAAIEWIKVSAVRMGCAVQSKNIPLHEVMKNPSTE